MYQVTCRRCQGLGVGEGGKDCPDCSGSGILYRHDGAERISMERTRQKKSEGFHSEHDDRWVNGELVKAAIAYLMPERFSDAFPFSFDWWKPRGRLSNLTKAGALIAAEIDRLLRKDEREQDEVVNEADL